MYVVLTTSRSLSLSSRFMTGPALTDECALLQRYTCVQQVLHEMRHRLQLV
jgi:hypothetical protein